MKRILIIPLAALALCACVPGQDPLPAPGLGPATRSVDDDGTCPEPFRPIDDFCIFGAP